MFKSPPQLRSGAKGKPVPLSTDKQKLGRSLSVSSAPTESGTSCTDKPSDNVAMATPAIVEQYVNKCLSGGEVCNNIVAQLRVELNTIVTDAVKSALSDVYAALKEFREEVTGLTAKLRELDLRLAEKTDDIEQYQRRNNVRFFGIEESARENVDELVVSLCRDKLGVDLPVEALCRTHRVGKQPPPTADGKKRHRPIIVKFVSYRDRRKVFDAKKKLKGSGITLREDLTACRLELYRRVMERHGMKNTWTQDGRVHWIDERGARGVTTRLADVV